MATTTKEHDTLDLGPIGMGLMQWGSTSIDEKVVNPKGNLSEQEVHDLWQTCRQKNIVFFDTAEGKLLNLNLTYLESGSSAEIYDQTIFNSIDSDHGSEGGHRHRCSH